MLTILFLIITTGGIVILDCPEEQAVAGMRL
jgi:hypothetical protein